MSGKLVVVGTPIGNLGDMSARAVQALEAADFIAAEDTRVTVKLLNHFGVKKPMVSYFEHNKQQKGEYIVARILAGETCALVSDAGMPAISDPGEELVAQCHANGIEVTVIPGPCAFVSALAISGLPTGRFTFEGFLSVNKKSRFAHLDAIKKEPRTMVFYEAPHKLLRTLRDLFEALGDRRIFIVRELTKIHEEVLLTTLQGTVEKYESTPTKGEFVLVVEGYKEALAPADAGVSVEAAIEMARALLGKGCTISDAAKQAAKATGLKKSDIYKGLLKG